MKLGMNLTFRAPRAYEVTYDGQSVKTLDKTLLMKWMIHDLKISLGNTKTLVEMVQSSPNSGVAFAEFDDMEIGREKFEILVIKVIDEVTK